MPRNIYTTIICLLICLLGLAQIGAPLGTARASFAQRMQAGHSSRLIPAPAQPISVDCGLFPGETAPTGSGTISGFVRDRGSLAPIAGVTVEVCGYGFGGGQYAVPVVSQGQAITDVSGYFSISNLPTEASRGPLTYSAVVSPLTSSRPTYEVRTLTGLILTDTTHVDVNLDPGETMSGVITDAYSNQALANVRIYAIYQVDPLTSPRNLLWLSTTSDAAGHYTLANLSTSTYVLLFVPSDPAYIWQEYPEVPDYYNDFILSSKPYQFQTISGKVIDGINAKLQRYASIEGNVTSAENGSPIAGTVVRIIPKNSALLYQLGTLTYTTDTNGHYTAPVPSGGYNVFINPPSTSGYPCQYYFDITKSDQVPLEIQVQQPDSLSVNTTLQRPGRIIGHVRY